MTRNMDQVIHLPAISGTGLIYGLVIIGFFIAFIVIQHWPRDENGKFMSPEEAEKVISKFRPRHSDDGGKKGLLVLVLIMVTLGAGLSKHYEKPTSSNSHLNLVQIHSQETSDLGNGVGA